MKTTEIPEYQDFRLEGVKHISPADAFEMLREGQAVLIDVREENEVKLDRIPMDGVLNHPMSVIMERLANISKEQNIIVGCPGGVRSSKVANLLNLQSYPHVVNLDGGFNMWRAKGFPYESSLSFGSSCGCGCTPSEGGAGEGSCC